MDYASALMKKGTSPTNTPTTPSNSSSVKPIARPQQPNPIAPPKTIVARSNDPVEAAGPFGKFSESQAGADPLVNIAVSGGPEVLSNLGQTCRFLKEKLLTNDVWSKLNLPKSKKASVQFRIDFPSTPEAESEETNEEETPEIKSGNIVSLKLSQLTGKNDNLRLKLISYWLDIATTAQNERANEARTVDVSKDPIAKRIEKEKIKVVLGGGFVISQQSKQQTKRIYTSQSLRDVTIWVDAINQMLGGQSNLILPCENQEVSLSRSGRGGSLITLKCGENRGTFDFAEFANAIRKNTEEYVRFVGLCLVLFRRKGGANSQENEGQYIERENVIKDVFGNISQTVKEIKLLLERGAIPNSNISDKLLQEKEERLRGKEQASKEYDRMTEFVRNNLPSDYAQAKLEADELNDADLQARDALKKKAELDRLERQKQKEAKREAQQKKKTDGEKDEEETAPPATKQREKRQEVKTVDEGGWITKEVRVVKRDGTTEPLVSQPAPSKPAKEEKKGKENNNNKNSNKNNANPKATNAQAQKSDEASKAFLDRNPFAAVLRADEVQAQNNKKTTAPKTQPKTASPKQQAKPKAEKKSEKETKPAEKQNKPEKKKAERKTFNDKRVQNIQQQKGNSVAIWEEGWFAPTFVAAGAVLTVVVAYTLWV